MSCFCRLTSVSLGTVCALLTAVPFVLGQGASLKVHKQTKERGRVVFSQDLPRLDGGQLKVSLVEVRYGPGEASLPHSHPCPVIGYVVAGELRTQVKGEPERVYKAGESFYEAPNGIHLLSANASATEAAVFIAYFVCDHDAPLIISVPIGSKARSK